MKLENRLIAIALFISIALSPVSCRKETPDPVPETPARETPAEKKTDTPELQFDGETSVLAYIGESVKVSFKASGEGKSSCKVEFTSDSKSAVEGSYNAASGVGYCNVTLNESAKHSHSLVKFTVKGGGKDRNYSVKVTAYYLDITGKDIVLPGNAGADAKLDYSINTNVPDFAPVISTEASWLKVEENTVTTTQENSSGETRTAEIIFSDKDGHLEPVTLKVSQETLAPQPKPGCVDFADWAFKKACLAIADTDNDGEVSLEEAAVVKKLSVAGKNISDIGGLDCFTSLEELDVSRNSLKELMLNDPAAFSNVKKINAEGNPTLERYSWSGCYPHCIRGLPVFYLEYDSKAVNITDIKYYESTDFSYNGIELIQEHTKGPKGIDLYFVTHAGLDVDYKSGAMRELVEMDINDLFLIEPFASLKGYFNIYFFSCVAPSTQSIGKYSDEQNTFMMERSLADYTQIVIKSCDAYYRSHASAPGAFPSYVAMGRSRMYAYSTASTTIVHEMGHALGSLVDQYIEEGRSWKGQCGPNFTEDNENLPWEKFFLYDQYKDRVGVYERNGGVYPSPESLMSSHRVYTYFDSPSRFAIYEYTMKGSGQSYDNDEIWTWFLDYDTINASIPY